MKKLIMLMMSIPALLMMSATFKTSEVTASDIENCETAEVRFTEVYEGVVAGVGACGFGLEQCSDGSVILIDKSGYNIKLGQKLKVTTSGIASCGRSIVSLTSSNCLPQ